MKLERWRRAERHEEAQRDARRLRRVEKREEAAASDLNEIHYDAWCATEPAYRNEAELHFIGWL